MIDVAFRFGRATRGERVASPMPGRGVDSIQRRHRREIAVAPLKERMSELEAKLQTGK